MKRLYFLIISLIISIVLISAVQINTGKTRTVTLQSLDKNAGSATLKKSADIIADRLQKSGIAKPDVKVLEKSGQLVVILPDAANLSELKGLISSKGDMSFYETYSHDEISQLFGTDNKVFKLLNNIPDQKSSDPRLGCTIENQKKVDEYLTGITSVKNSKFSWGSGSDKSGRCLFALKINAEGKPLLVRSDIESVKVVAGNDKLDSKIHITLKPAAKTVFADATKNNLNKSIAIVIDDQVYSWPVLKSVIEGGEIEITGSFTPDEVNYFPVLFNSGQLPVNFMIVK